MHELNTAADAGFDHLNLSSATRRGIAAAGFTEPRPIQERAIPAALAGRDVLGLAQTGTGKTAAFAIPVIERLLATQGSGIRALAVAPTRELAAQISAEIRMLAKFTHLKVATVFGGVSVHGQRKALAAKPQILVACPGRLLDLMGQGLIRLDRVEVLILDEADHMFDMGFLPDVRRILKAVPTRRQTLLFSATMPAEIRSLADRSLTDPHSVDVAHKERLTTIEHALYPVDATGKLELLTKILADGELDSAIVFTRTKHRAKRLARQLDNKGFRAVALQGNMSQNQRERAMDGFRKRRFDILVATDIAARGIDVDKVSHVVNFDMPNTPTAYTHRIGRTGRSEQEGKAYTFVTSDDRSMVAEVERKLQMPIPRRRVEGVEPIHFPDTRPAASAPQKSRRRRPSGAGRPSQGRRRQRARRS